MPGALHNELMMSGADVALPYCNLAWTNTRALLNPFKKK